jgi:hypothetical protein
MDSFSQTLLDYGGDFFMKDDDGLDASKLGHSSHSDRQLTWLSVRCGPGGGDTYAFAFYTGATPAEKQEVIVHYAEECCAYMEEKCGQPADKLNDLIEVLMCKARAGKFTSPECSISGHEFK